MRFKVHYVPRTCGKSHTARAILRRFMAERPGARVMMEHEASPDCWCEPERYHVEPDGSTVYLHRERH